MGTVIINANNFLTILFFTPQVDFAKMRVAIIGQSQFAGEVYKLLQKDGHKIAGVFTIPDVNGRPDALGTFSNFFWYFLKSFYWTEVHFVEPLIPSVWDFGWDSNPGWIHCRCTVLLLACNNSQSSLVAGTGELNQDHSPVW